MQTFVTVLHIVICFLLVVLVLIQSGKGAEISASLGGSSQTVFGSSGGANFFTRFTATLAAIFMTTSIILTILQAKSRESVFEQITAPAAGAADNAKTAPVGAAPVEGGTTQEVAPAVPEAERTQPNGN